MLLGEVEEQGEGWCGACGEKARRQECAGFLVWGAPQLLRSSGPSLAL